MTAKAVQPVWRLGAILAAATVALDQLSKYYVVEILRLGEARFAEGQGPIAIAPFLDLSFVPNPGISYGLFPQNSEVGRWILIGLTLAAVIFIAVWILRTRSLLTSAALGLIAGGAIGNGLDRAHYGAVVDFLHLHGGAIRWLDFPYLFNVADAAISLGVVLLLAESLIAKKPALEQSHRTG